MTLAREAAAGDPRAQRLLLDRVLERVRVTARYISGDHRDQDDWVQLTLMEILRSAGGFRGDSSLAAWSDRIAVRTVLRQLKRSRRRDERSPMSDGGVEPTWTGNPDTEHCRLAMRRRLARHLGSLAPDFSTALVLKAVHGHSVEEIAALTEAPFDTVRDRLARARRQLRKKLAADPVFEGLAPRRLA